VRPLVGLARRVGRRLRTLAERREKPRPSLVLTPGGDATELRDVWAAPALGLAIDAQGQVFGAAADLAHAPGAWRSGQDVRFPLPADAPAVAAGVLFMDGRATRNYAHFLLDALPTLLAIEPTAVLAPPLTRWQTDLVALAGAQPPIEITAPLVRVERLTFAPTAPSLTPGPHLDPMRAAILAALDMPPAPPRRVYVSGRAGLKAVLDDELRLEMIMEARGYRILRPETSSPRELIAAFRDAERVVAATGTLMANLLFCAPGTQVIELRPPGVDGDWIEALARHADLAWKAYASHEPIDAAEALLDVALRPASAFGWRLDLPAFLDFLDGEG
jgi:capsular polysaccharide biosynthesis protein